MSCPSSSLFTKLQILFHSTISARPSGHSGLRPNTHFHPSHRVGPGCAATVIPPSGHSGLRPNKNFHPTCTIRNAHACSHTNPPTAVDLPESLFEYRYRVRRLAILPRVAGMVPTQSRRTEQRHRMNMTEQIRAYHIYNIIRT